MTQKNVTMVDEQTRKPLPLGKLITLALGTLTTMTLLSCGGDRSPSAPTEEALFRIRAEDAQAFRIAITEPQTVLEARKLLQSREGRWVTGVPVRGSSFNHGWSWHLDPPSISFAEVTIEACQTTLDYLEDNLDYWIDFGEVCVDGHVEAEEG